MDTATTTHAPEVRHLTPLDYMSLPDTAWSWAKELMHVTLLHQEHAASNRKRVRSHDLVTPFAVHPLQCALAALSEPVLDGELRVKLFRVLLYHELEAQTGIKPDFLQLPIQEMIRSLRCLGHGALGWSAPPEIRLAKLYSLVFDLQDGQLPQDAHANLLHHLVTDVAENYGVLNIVKLAYTLPRNDDY